MTATKTLKRPSLERFKAYVRRECKPLVAEMLAARVFAEHERRRVDAYIAPIFNEYTFTVHPDFADCHTEPLTEKTLYLTDMNAPAYLEYCERVLQAHTAHGWTGNPEHCPALSAEHEATQAEQRVIESVAGLMGFKASGVYGDTRKKLLDMAIGACLADDRGR